MLLAGEYIYADKKELIPFLIFGCLCFLSAMLTSILPETLDRQLPDTLEEAVLQVILQELGMRQFCCVKRQCDSVLRLLIQAQLRKMFAPRSQNGVWTQYFAIM